ncbi:MAG: GtrA family protein [Drouetiella hepatica Uher 2000/2452]|jgi:hypothetical protein|uniref:GtrA family protein n=1 Tax=Drouetiella hepatica Uher 2000/2452 TaxID=904376 RepID=A0A951UMQ1_9CYAN|nr:GtrA family protein [Drouetiella hepatica Uher 2000/2452]
MLNTQQSSCFQVPTGLLKVPGLTEIYSQGGDGESIRLTLHCQDERGRSIALPKVLSSITEPMSGYFLVGRQAIAGISLAPGYKILLEVLGRGNIGGWTFKDLAQQQGSQRRTLKCLPKFNPMGLMGLILQVLLLNLLFNALHLNPYLANFLAIAAVAIWNLWINLKLNWQVT